MVSLLKVRGRFQWSSPLLTVLFKPQHPGTVKLLTICQTLSTSGNMPCSSRSITHNATSASMAVMCQSIRHASTKMVEGDSLEPKQQMTWFQQFWRWLHDMDDLDRWDNPQTNQEELDEREAFLNRVQEMYFSNPPQRPDLQFCKESLHMLMKYNDRVAVQTLWNILPELKVEPDDELQARVEAYMKKARQQAYYE